ncbi:hypothetical protein P171DRAFT_427279 [Karstenula rhodostoma CBS 690.94]|uniref:Uncharacterized protein n=1 Tax=Karstenula rhodostoma CBS 690.94 TaxID=1392251 RepID=A0A9P4PY72_9PLEO|nr:hypothetical protein P171DRAFT_427279 [Karstenula rhodostoma CBS 690.94]
MTLLLRQRREWLAAFAGFLTLRRRSPQHHDGAATGRCSPRATVSLCGGFKVSPHGVRSQVHHRDAVVART